MSISMSNTHGTYYQLDQKIKNTCVCITKKNRLSTQPWLKRGFFEADCGQQIDKITPHHQKSGSSIVKASGHERATDNPQERRKWIMTDNTGRIGHAAKITMRRHGLIAPPSSVAETEARRTLSNRFQWL